MIYSPGFIYYVVAPIQLLRLMATELAFYLSTHEPIALNLIQLNYNKMSPFLKINLLRRHLGIEILVKKIEVLQLIWLQEMGNDGGDIPGRKELVRQKKKVQFAPSELIAMGRARFCNLTNNPLKAPLAICRLGNIYNYEQILGALARKELPAKYAYIRKLTDIRQVIIDRTSSDSLNYIACPITKLEYNGFNKFVAFWPCGHLVSKKALKQVKSQQRQCIICQEPYDEKDLIDLNLQGQLLQNMRKNLIEKRKKKGKKQDTKQEIKDELTKKVKTDIHINTLDRLGGEFRDVIRNRENFKDIFKKEEEPQWKKNTYFIAKNGEEVKEK